MKEIMHKQLFKAIFLDRDGVINKEKKYVHKIKDFEFIPGVFEALRKFTNLGYKLIIITNQAGIGKGFYKEEDLNHLHEYMLSILKLKQIKIHGIYFCPHHEEAKLNKYKKNCNCRKPKPGMILKAASEHSIDLNQSIMIGDKISDYYAGINSGIQISILLRSGHKLPTKYLKELKYISDDLLSSSKLIEKMYYGELR